MAIIYTYPDIGTPENTDIMLISDVSLDSNATRNITLSNLGQFINSKVELVITGDVGSGFINLSTQALSVIGTTNQIQTSAVNQTIQIGLPDSVQITNTLDVGNDIVTPKDLFADRGFFTGQVTIPLTPSANTDAASKGYVDSQLDKDLQIQGDTGTGSINLDTQVFDVAGGTYIDTAAGGQTITVDISAVDGNAGANERYLTKNNTWVEIATSGGDVGGSGTVNTIPIWSTTTDLADSQITQDNTGADPIFDFNGITNANQYTPPTNTVLYKLKSGNENKFSVTQDGGGGVVLPSGDILNSGPSFNMGGNAFANGENALSVGASTTAFGNGSLAANFLTLASGGGASAFGLLTEASALASASFGNKSKATGAYSIASGQDSIASGQSSVAIGEKGDAQGKNTFVQGFGGTATANNAAKFGFEGAASGSNSAKFGFESVASGPNSFAIGDGTTASGFQSIAAGDNNVVSNNNSFVGGKNSTVTGAESIAYGLTNTLSANSCAIFGNANIITSGSFQSFVAGTSNTTNSFGEVKLIGRGLAGASQEGVYLGKYNDDSDNYNKFQIGNGSSTTKSNSLSINNAGNIKIPTYGSGTVTGTVAYNLSVASNGQIIETPVPAAPAYLSTVLLVSQSGATAPVNNNVLENGLGIPTPFNWTRVSTGEYNLNAPGKFKLLKTIVFLNGGSVNATQNVAWEVVDTDNLRILTHNNDGKLTKASLEIRTYN